MAPDTPACPYRRLAPPPALREHLQCAWTIGPASAANETTLPDGSIDIVWGEVGAPLLAGPDTRPVPSTRPPGTTVVGVSFRPGAAPALLGIPADQLRDLRVPLADVWGRDAARLEQRLDDGSPAARLKLIKHELQLRLECAERPDELVAAAVTRLHRPDPRPHGPAGSDAPCTAPAGV